MASHLLYKVFKDSLLVETQSIETIISGLTFPMFERRKIERRKVNRRTMERRKNNRLGVSYLNYSVTNHLLEELFSRHGKVINVRVNREKGFGLIEMSSLTEAERAKKALNGFDFEGRTLQVDKYYSSKHQNGKRRASKKIRFRKTILVNRKATDTEITF